MKDASKSLVWAMAVIGLGVITQPCRAEAVLYLDRASFNAATTADTTFNFDNLAPRSGFTYFGSSVTTNGVTFTAPNASLFAIGKDYAGGLFAFDSANVVLQDNTNPSTVTTLLPAGTTAVGFDVGAQFRLAGTAVLTLALASGSMSTFAFDLAARPGLNFVGVTSDQAIASATISTPDFGLSYADVTLGQAVVPEPSTLGMAGLGGVICLGAVWRRRKGATA